MYNYFKIKSTDAHAKPEHFVQVMTFYKNIYINLLRSLSILSAVYQWNDTKRLWFFGTVRLEDSIRVGKETKTMKRRRTEQRGREQERLDVGRGKWGLVFNQNVFQLILQLRAARKLWHTKAMTLFMRVLSVIKTMMTDC